LSVRVSIIGLGVALGGFLAGVINALVIPATAIALTGAVIAIFGVMILVLLQATPSILPREE
jgi:predicted MFS family arabinose efflux permease